MFWRSNQISRGSAVRRIVRPDRFRRAVALVQVAGSARSIIVTLSAASLLAALSGCGGGGGDSSGPTNGGSTSPALVEQTIYTNPHDGMLYSATTADGEELTYFGRRNEQGNILLITDLDYVAADGERYRITFDANGLPSRVQDEDGLTLEMDFARAPMVTPASALHTQNLRVDEVPFIDFMVALAQVGGQSGERTEIRARLIPDGETPLAVGFNPRIPELHAFEPTGNVEVNLRSCGEPATSNGEVTVNVRGIGRNPSWWVRFPAEPTSQPGRFIARIPERVPDLAVSEEVCASFGETLSNICQIVSPVQEAGYTHHAGLSDPRLQGALCTKLAAGVEVVTGPIPASPQTFAACLAMLNAPTVLCNTLGFSPSAAPDAENVLQRICGPAAQLTNAVGLTQYEIQAAWVPPGDKPSQPLYSTLETVSTQAPFSELVIDDQTTRATLETEPAMPKAGHGYTAHSTFSCARDRDLSVTASRSLDGSTLAMRADPAGSHDQSASLSVEVPGTPIRTMDTVTALAFDPDGEQPSVRTIRHVSFPERPTEFTEIMSFVGTGTTVDTYTSSKESIRCASEAHWTISVNPNGTLWGSYRNPKFSSAEFSGWEWKLGCVEKETPREVTFSGTFANGRFEIPSEGKYYWYTNSKFLANNTMITGDIDTGRIATNPTYIGDMSYTPAHGVVLTVEHSFELFPKP